jgi:hypothetical protein
MRIVLVVPRFPKLSETFIVNKFVGLVDAGWDVHVVCAATGDWSDFPQMEARPELRRRVQRQWPHDVAWKAALLFLPVLLLTGCAPPAPRRVTGALAGAKLGWRPPIASTWTRPLSLWPPTSCILSLGPPLSAAPT